MQYTYYFVRVEDKKLTDFPARVELDISEDWHEVLHEEDNVEHANDEYQRRLANYSMKNPGRFRKAILGPEEAFFQNERDARLHMALATLTPYQRFLVETIIIDREMKVTIAARLGISKAAVGQQLAAAITRLQKNFSDS